MAYFLFTFSFCFSYLCPYYIRLLCPLEMRSNPPVVPSGGPLSLSSCPAGGESPFHMVTAALSAGLFTLAVCPQLCWQCLCPLYLHLCVWTSPSYCHGCHSSVCVTTHLYPLPAIETITTITLIALAPFLPNPFTL